MPVIDATGRLVGSVKYIKRGTPTADRPTADRPTADEDLETAFARALTETEPQVDAELAEELVRQGFLKVTGAGLMDNDLYVLPDQIAVADDDAVRLSAAVTELTVEREHWF
ncbi:hypothetical protein [Kribbella caucasensis]|nr:hypothetical protein [Kribbella sp. VKM Ac-2527]